MSEQLATQLYWPLTIALAALGTYVGAETAGTLYSFNTLRKFVKEEISLEKANENLRKLRFLPLCRKYAKRIICEGIDLFAELREVDQERYEEVRDRFLSKFFCKPIF